MAGINLLTDTAIRAMAKDAYLSDGGFLFLRKRGDGKNWVFRFKIPRKATWAKPGEAGKAVELGLGPYPARSLKDARREAETLRSDLANDRDPRERFKVKDEEVLTFKIVADRYIKAAEKKFRNEKHKQQWRNTLRDYVYPTLGEKPIADITRRDIEKTLQPLWDAGKIETFSRVRMRIEKVLNAGYHELDIDRRNPARWVDNLKISFGDISPRAMAEGLGKLKPHAAAKWQDVPAIMTKLRDKPDVISALAMRFSILTAARSGEVRGLVWDEIDLDGAAWDLPKERSKNKQPHRVPLNAEAVEILTGLKAKADPEQPRVFPGAKGGLLSDVAVNKVLHAAMPGVTAHGTARSSFRDWVAEATNFPDKVAEAALNHTNPNETEAAYLRTKFFDRRIELMKVWGEFLKGKDNVVGIGIANTG